MHEARLVRVVRNKRVYRLQLPRHQPVPNHGPVRRLHSFSHLMLMPMCRIPLALFNLTELVSL